MSHSTDLMCPFGKILSQCYTECVPECGGGSECPEGCQPDGPNCTVCAAGCFCPPGLQIYGDICLPEDVCPDIDEGDIEPVDKCSVYEDCNECISSDPDCQWCPYEPGEVSVIGSRCRVRGGNPVCPVEIEDPMNSVEAIIDEEFGDMVQVRPQKLRLELRAGEPQEITLQFRPAENFPLDVYFLLDVTGSFSQSFRDTVTPLATELVDALRNISEQYAVAFGSFGDKRAIPYALSSDNINAYRTGNNFMTCTNSRINDINDCNPTISFRHTTNFSPLTDEELESVLGNISIHLNVDSLEGGMDALLQALACREEVGWRNQSLRMLLYMSNAEYHLAGDGKVGAAFRPNPGQCALESRTEDGMTFLEYTQDIVYDYPSVYQLREMIGTTETNVIFAVTGIGEDGTDDLKAVYQGLIDELGPFARVSLLESDAANLINVIQTTYDDISQEVRFTGNEYPGLDFTFTPGEGCDSSDNDTEVCTNVTIGKTVTFNVTVTMTSCLEETTTVTLQSTAFGNIELEIVPLCECSCNDETNVVEDSDLCNGTGDLVCGQCQCPPGTYGDMCQCEDDGSPQTCGVAPANGLECSGLGRGVCECGDCLCFVQEDLLAMRNFTEPYFGEHCECDHLTSCQGILTENGELCSGHGDCICEDDECECTTVEEKTGLVFGGDLCDCDPIICYSEEHQETCKYVRNDDIVIPNAKCNPCTGCECRSGTMQGGDGTCVLIPDFCDDNEDCARCVKGLERQGVDCQTLKDCNASLYTEEMEPENITVRCSFTDDDDCTHLFYIVEATINILVEDTRACLGGDEGQGIGNLAWIIPVAVIAGLLVLGGIILLLVLLIVCIKDRMEYTHFKKDLEDANWDQQENPMYVSPNTQYSNVTYRPKTKADNLLKESEE